MDQLLSDLLMEYNLTIAFRLGHDCDCAKYLVGRKQTLIPTIMKVAEKDHREPVDIFVEFQQKVHKRHG